MQYIISIDQSTQGTKALLFDKSGELICRTDVAHKQITNNIGWISHNMEEIYANLIVAVKELMCCSGIRGEEVACVGITNQRETALIWDRAGKPIHYAVVWQCARAKDICMKLSAKDAQNIQERTGLSLSPYYPAAKWSWLLENTEGAKEKFHEGSLFFGTVDTWLLYKLTNGQSYKTDYSNASRTQLFDIYRLEWDDELCSLFGLNAQYLPEVCESNAVFGETDLEGALPVKVPICCMMGDSHGALFGQGCLKPGMVKATYGTGSSVMMHIGNVPICVQNGVATSLAWCMDGKVEYVLEGNIISTGGIISWLKNNLGMIDHAAETEELAQNANAEDQTYIVPAFTGLGAPYWDDNAKAIVYGMGYHTHKAEFVKAAVESIAYQINDVLQTMQHTSGIGIKELRVDGGAAQNKYLMQFQSDISNIDVLAADVEELSGLGAAYMAGIAMGILNREEVFCRLEYRRYKAEMKQKIRDEKCAGWMKAVRAARL